MGQLQITELDLGNLKSVRTCAQNLLQTENSIDLLVNNAGIMMCPQGKTEDGFELQLGTNHLGPFLLTMLLLPKICQNKKAKIINVSSIAHKSKFVKVAGLSTAITVKKECSYFINRFEFIDSQKVFYQTIKC